MSGQAEAAKARELLLQGSEASREQIERAQAHALLAVYEELRLTNERRKPKGASQ